jgi:hypothetical protein
VIIIMITGMCRNYRRRQHERMHAHISAACTYLLIVTSFFADYIAFVQPAGSFFVMHAHFRFLAHEKHNACTSNASII